MDNKIFQRDYASYYNLFYKDKNYEEEVAYVHQLIEKYGIPNAATLLDFGCGTGAHDVYFSKKGFHVTGIDKSADMVKIASTSSNPNLNFKIGDIQSLELDKKFDVITSLFHVLNYQINHEQLLKCFLSAKKHLNVGGIFIFDFWHGAAVLANRPSIRIKKVENENVLITRISEPFLKIHDATIDIKFTFYMQNKVTHDNTLHFFEEVHYLRYWFLWELTSLLEQAGFKKIKFEEWLTSKEVSIDSWYGCAIVS